MEAKFVGQFQFSLKGKMFAFAAFDQGILNNAQKLANFVESCKVEKFRNIETLKIS